MNLYFRLLFILLFSRYRESVLSLGPCRTTFRCWPTDLDILRHMNNGKYFSLMDLARVDLMERAGLSKKMSERGWYPVVVAETAIFKKSLKLFNRFEIETKIIGWDKKAVLIKHTFFQKEKIMCEAVVRGRFLRKSGGSVNVDELLEAFDITSDEPRIEPWISDWNQNQQ